MEVQSNIPSMGLKMIDSKTGPAAYGAASH